jgi:hypothetical protein
MLQLKQALEMS